MGVVVLGFVAVALAMGAAGALSDTAGPSVELSGADSVSPGDCHLRGHADPGSADRILIDVAGRETASMTIDRPTTWGFDVPANSTVTAVAVDFGGEADVLAERQLTAGCTLTEGP
ncbi:hypothetical protein BVU17_18135 (plasmid) [Haloarcula taiwanensis]|uniref:Uncharacterized protein n=1 Tax=Haloarcula taiwanensis TaxID=1932004 RepID=A0A2H5A4A1_9EURY|nr:hypothetical protein BVU17_18135 [Haloarcula taiwanensis]